jgi:hypothetical protein
MDADPAAQGLVPLVSDLDAAAASDKPVRASVSRARYVSAFVIVGCQPNTCRSKSNAT